MKLSNDRRTTQKTISLESIVLTPSQVRTIHTLEESGWHLWFVRRSYYLDALPVVVQDETGQTATIDKAGLMETNHGLHFREPEPIPRVLH